MSEDAIRLVSPAPGAAPDLRLDPGEGDLQYVGFELARLAAGTPRSFPADRLERCFVPLSGSVELTAGADAAVAVGGRPSPFDGPPAAFYAPAGTEVGVLAADGGCDLAICVAPGGGAHVPYAVQAGEVEVEHRGEGPMAREVRPILMGDRPAHSLLVVEVLTPAGHWSSFPPHKHDRDDPPRETLLEETYYHRIDPPQGFGFQRVYAGGEGPDKTFSFADGDLVTVPFGYHTVAMPPGYRGYYLNVMAGPVRDWRFADDPDHTWLRSW